MEGFFLYMWASEYSRDIFKSTQRPSFGEAEMPRSFKISTFSKTENFTHFTFHLLTFTAGLPKPNFLLKCVSKQFNLEIESCLDLFVVLTLCPKRLQRQHSTGDQTFQNNRTPIFR